MLDTDLQEYYSNPKRCNLIAVDFDDVLFDCNAALQCIIRNEFYDTTSYIEFVTKYPYLKNEIFRFLYERYHHDCTAISDTHSALLQLATSHRLVVVTGRSESTSKQTEKWLENNFHNLFSAVYFTNAFLRNPGEVKRRKVDICADLGVDILIDDSIEEVISVSLIGITAFLFDRPWNRVSAPTTICRVKDWNHILSKISNKTEEGNHVDRTGI